MANVPAWFDYNVYMTNKLAQLEATGVTDYATVDALKAAFPAVFGTAEGAYQHFQQFGANEEVSPTAGFNAAAYYAFKAADYYDKDISAVTQTEIRFIQDAVKAAGMNAWTHYTQFGAVEGINPSNSFDSAAYLTAKAAALGGDWTAETVAEAIRDAGMNPYEHFVLYAGKGEGEVAEGATFPVPAAEQTHTNYNPYNPGTPGTTFELTTAVDVIEGTANDDVINGVASSLTKEATLNAGDQIDGAAGNDTLNVTMNGNFTGFTGAGEMVNVENVVLTNSSTMARTFNAAGITGVETYTLNAEKAAISLTNLAEAGITVNVNDLASGAVGLGFTAAAVKGTSDALTLGLDNVGTAAEGTTAAKAVTVTAAGIEHLTVNASGENYADLSGVTAATAIAATGAGSLDVTKVATTVTSFDASAMSGDLTADLTLATKLATLKGGAGDDSFTVTNLAANATVEGGAGDDTLVLKTVSGTLQPTLSGFETVEVAGTAGLTISGKNVQDLTGLTLSATNTAVTLANLEADAFTVTAKGATTGTVTLTDATALTYSTEATAATVAAKTAETVNYTLNAANATTATINVGEYTTLTGAISVNKATDVTVNVASGLNTKGDTELTSFDATLNATGAASLTVNAEGTLGATATFNVAKAESVSIDAAQGGSAKIIATAANTVDITAGAGLSILTGSNFDAAQTVTLTQDKGALLASNVDFKGINELTVSGAYTSTTVPADQSQITVGNLSNAQDYGITVNVSELAGGFTFGTIDTKNDVVLNLTDATGAVKGSTSASTNDDIKGANVTVYAAQLGTTTLGDIVATGDVAINALGILGGAGTKALDIDDISITQGHTANISFDGGSLVDIGKITATGANISGTSVTLDASSYLGTVGGASSDATVGAITAETVTIYGSELKANTFNTAASNIITADNLTFTGGLENDKVELTGLTAATGTAATIKLSVDAGVGDADALTVNTAAGTGSTTVTGTVANVETLTFKLDAASTGIDISGLTYGDKSNIDGSAATAATTIKGGAGADTITGGAGGGTITGGLGADVITLAADTKSDTVVVAAGDSTTTAFDSITGFKAIATNGDTLDLATTTVLTALTTGWTVTSGIATKGSATLDDFIAAFSTATTAGVVAFEVGGNTYVGVSDGSYQLTNDDTLIELVGVTSATAVGTTAADNTIHIA